MLLTWIAEVAQEPLLLDPADHQAELDTNTWWLSAGDEERPSLTVSEVVTALEGVAAALRIRVRALGFSGVATFYVWHDEQAGQLRCSVGSVAARELPFRSTYVPSRELEPVVAGFLDGDGPGLPFLRVWAADVGGVAS
ncbi:hypothetical protein ACFU3O_16065 [Streptomyces antibioticus]|uniref:hypothetical protein n=1 Tax=Streptomyces antibioticus TaxID=1890 RepID=UPI0036B8285B